MTLNDLGNLGEITGGLAVVVSLVYLATQIRQNSALTRFKVHRSLSESTSAIMADIARNPDIYRVWRTMIDTPDTATDEERERFGILLYQIFSNFSDADRFSDIDSSLEVRYSLYRNRLLTYESVRDWWARQGRTFSEPFKSRVDRYIADNYGKRDS